MEHGGNDPWKEFFDSHTLTIAEGRTFDDCTIKERYEGEVGEEWKARLTAKAEGKAYVPEEKRPDMLSRSNSATPSLSMPASTGRSASPAHMGGQKERNEAYFARMGEENNYRPDNLPPSQGGKFSGFGGGVPTPSRDQQNGGGGAIPGINDFQNDPVAALTKGFGWFTTTVGKSAKTVNDSYIQPTAKQVRTSFTARFMP